MKASQILRESQGKRNQHFGHYIELNIKGEVVSYCALGALACEIGVINKDGSYNKLSESLEKVFGITPAEKMYENKTNYDTVNCNIEKGKPKPNCSHTNNIFHFITHLNDQHHLTFEEIAEILEKYGL